MRKTLIIAAISAATLAAGCGGGGDSPAPTNVAGLWNGTTSTGRTVAALTFQDGTGWALYTPEGNPAYLAGVVQATTTVSGATASGPITDYNLEGGGITSGTISTTVNPKQSISGTVNPGGVTFSGTYDAAFEQAPSLTETAGTFTGTAAVLGGTESASVTVSTTGALSGSSASGCAYTGTVTPRTDGNAFNVSVTFGGGVCSNGTSTVNGIAYYAAATKRIYSAASNSAKTNGFIFLGTKP